MRAMWLTLVAATIGASPAWAQDEGVPPPPPPAAESREARQPERDEAIRRELRDRLAWTERQQARITRAMKILEEGGSREDLFALLRDIRESAERAAFRPDDGAGRRGPRGETGPPGPDGGGPGRPGDPQPVTLTPEQRAEILALVKEHMPEMYARLESLREKDPGAEDRIVSRFAPMFLDFLELREADPIAADLKIREFQTGAAIMRAIGEVRAAKFAKEPDSERLRTAVADLRSRIVDQIEIRLAVHEHEIATIRERLARAERELAEERSKRDTLVEEKVDQILRDLDRRERRGRP